LQQNTSFDDILPEEHQPYFSILIDVRRAIFTIMETIGRILLFSKSFNQAASESAGAEDNIKNQLHAIERAMYKSIDIEKQLKKSIVLLDKQLKEIEVLINQQINKNQDVKRKFESICKIKGLGILTLAIIIAETNGFILFNNSSQLVSYAGYDIIENQSGNHNGKTKISKKGNSRIRRALFIPALSAVTHKKNVC